MRECWPKTKNPRCQYSKKKRRGYLIYVKKLKEIAEGDFFLEFDIKNQSFPLNLCAQICPP